MTAVSVGTVAEGIDWIRSGDETVDGRNLVKEGFTNIMQAAGASSTSTNTSYGFVELGAGGLALRAPMRLAEKIWTPAGIEVTNGLSVTVQAIQTERFRGYAVGSVIGPAAYSIIDGASK